MGKPNKILVTKLEVDEGLSEELEMAVILKFLTQIIGEYLGSSDEKEVIGMIISINMNLMNNGMLCPKCFKDAMNAIIDETFTIEDVDDTHEVSIKADGPMGNTQEKPKFH